MSTTNPLSAVFGGSKPLTLLAALLAAGPDCQLVDAELFTGPDLDEPDPVRHSREARAKAICAGCPARTACLNYALTLRPRDGVWAGFTADEISSLTRIFTRIDIPKEVA